MSNENMKTSIKRADGDRGGNILHHRRALRTSGPEARCTVGVGVKDQPEEEEDGSAVGNPINVVIVIHVGLYGVDEARVKLLSLVEDEQSLRATQHHVPDGFSKLSLNTERTGKLQSENSPTSRNITKEHKDKIGGFFS